MPEKTWGDYAESWDSNDAAIDYAQHAFESLAPLLAAIDDGTARVLDFGCGTGLLTEKLSPRVGTIFALDPSEKMIAVLEAKQLANVETITSLLSPDLISTNARLHNRFDLIVASSALAFVPDYPHTVHLLASLLKDNGYLVQWDWLLEDGDTGPGFTEAELHTSFELAQLTDIQVTRPFSMQMEGTRLPVVMAVGINRR
ncbi:class I SAM-dependent methyltransferase [Microbulbifer salipaludis]|uniref:Class I SAM-dependent methyltransferase n=1 Tax=Microbulbifer salipaludis TaxID=187980 RepID=A0ABS3E6V9_9GAMM|nr:class I SAM-dependent methyltransferase [Microbulbifer salipaludis]MBN8430948.1 class I SAM-dependent methyltransferase [Microbulbifer salipaludis]